MNGFLSSKETAQQVATQMQQALQQLEKEFDSNTDNQTTVLGNTEGHKVSDAHQSVIAAFISAFQKDIANIHSVADEFEAVDDQIKAGLTKLLP